MRTYLFYDLETSGLNPAFDQIFQFAAIRTDLQFREIEREEFQVRLREDVIPSPGALVTHRIPLEKLQEGMTEYAAANRIHQMMNTPGTTSLGYNTLGFDDGFLRFCFYRNLLSPYTHQFKDGCSRMDVFPMAIFFRLFKPGVLEWPEVDGEATLKLEHLSEANGLADGPAHDAMVDVEATVNLARRFAGENEMWQYLSGYFAKQTDNKRMDALPEAFRGTTGVHRHGIMVSSKFGRDADFMAPVLYLGRSAPYKNQTLWLRLDLPELKDSKADDFDETTWVIRKRDGEPGMLLPPADRFRSRISEEGLGIMAENLEWIQDNPTIFNTIVSTNVAFRYADVDGIDADAALYQAGFFSREEDRQAAAFHLAEDAGEERPCRKHDPSPQGTCSPHPLPQRHGRVPSGDPHARTRFHGPSSPWPRHHRLERPSPPDTGCRPQRDSPHARRAGSGLHPTPPSRILRDPSGPTVPDLPDFPLTGAVVERGRVPMTEHVLDAVSTPGRCPLSPTGTRSGSPETTNPSRPNGGHSVPSNRPVMSVSGLLVAMILVMAFSLIDWILVPEQYGRFLLFRSVVIFPPLATVLGLTFWPRFREIQEPVLVILSLFVGGGVLYLNVMQSPEMGGTYAMGSVLVLFYVYTFLHLRYPVAAVCGWTITLGHRPDRFLHTQHAHRSCHRIHKLHHRSQRPWNGHRPFSRKGETCRFLFQAALPAGVCGNPAPSTRFWRPRWHSVPEPSKR